MALEVEKNRRSIRREHSTESAEHLWAERRREGRTSERLLSNSMWMALPLLLGMELAFALEFSLAFDGLL